MKPTLDLGLLQRVPYQPIRWPMWPEVHAQVRQIQASSQPVQLANGLPNTRMSSMNMPKPVRILSVSSVLVGTKRKLIISFLHNPEDPNFQKVNLHLKQGGGLPVVIASGAVSPITVMIDRTRVPATFFLQAEGNWGPHPLQNSPSRSVSLM